MMNIIEVQELSKSYLHKQKRSVGKGFLREKIETVANKNISFDVKKGELLGIIGPNGAGKTTLIKMLTGIIKPTSGNMSILGFNPANLCNDLKMKYAIVMGQKSMLWWDLPAIDSLKINQAIYSVPNHLFKEKLEYFDELFSLKHIFDKQVRLLSLGERMKLELINCLIHDPEIIFLDEPTIGLDVIAQKNMRRFLQKINKEMGKTILLTSHYMKDIQDLCSRVLIINEGQKVYDGDLDYVLAKFCTYKTLNVTFEDKEQTSRFEKFVQENDFKFEVIDQNDYKMSLKIPIHVVEFVLSALVNTYRINDINIADEDISDVIENIYRNGVNL